PEVCRRARGRRRGDPAHRRRHLGPPVDRRRRELDPRRVPHEGTVPGRGRAARGDRPRRLGRRVHRQAHDPAGPLERPRRPAPSPLGRVPTMAVAEKLPRKPYERELLRLQEELVKMAEWIRDSGARVVIIFEGRDAAGKGGAIKRITEFLNPRIARIVALPVPTERERTQWYFQRYVAELPAAG